MRAETEPALLPVEYCRQIFDQVQAAARASGVQDIELLIGARAEALTRFANNSVHQNVAEQVTWLSVRAVIGQRTARATTNHADPDAIRSVVEDAIALTKA